MANVLHGLDFSPWTERARWALDHHAIAHRFRQHVPMLGELGLRWRARSVDGGSGATVPLWVGERGRVMGSLAIIRHADAVGAGQRLMRNERAVIAVEAAADRALKSVRGRVTSRILADRAALREAASAAVPSWLAGPARPVARVGARFLARKHAVPIELEDAEYDEVLREALDEFRLRLGGRSYMDGDEFSAADICAATLLQAVEPVRVPWIRIGPATRSAWAHPQMAEHFADLIAWRDRLYQRHRSSSPGA